MINLEKYHFDYDPFPHCVVENLFEEKFYYNLCEEFPKQHEMNLIRDKSKSLKKFYKYTLDSNETKKKFYKYLDRNIHMKELIKYISSKAFYNNLSAFLELNHIDLGLGELDHKFITKIKNYFKKKELSWYFEFSSIPVPDGHIMPHTDGSNKILSFVIPIIDNENILNVQDLGTTILKANKDKYKYNYNNKVVPFSDADVVKILPFKKNMMNLHIKTFNSLHSVGPFNVSDGQSFSRNSITCFLKKD
tara:strand:- start:1465 stop:2208 length:744 start_codon:yes stop_codon:yes gene_type:complete